MGESGRGRAPVLTAEVKKMLADLRVSDDEEPRRKSIIPTDKELLDDEGEDGPIVSSPEVKEQIAKVKREEASGATRPAPIKTPALSPDELSDASRPPPIKKPPLIIDNTPAPEPKPAAGTATARTGGLNGLLGGEKKAAAPSRPDTYVVQPGDTLMHIAARFYGSRSKWRDIRNANLATIPADGRVKEGMTIKLP
jgi:LysM repeat protein